jgi:hypothetical protein
MDTAAPRIPFAPPAQPARAAVTFGRMLVLAQRRFRAAQQLREHVAFPSRAG